MNTVELLKEFAKEQGINVAEVDKFLSKWNSPKTLDELLNLPKNLLNHVSYISYLDDPLKSFIGDEIWWERYMTIDLHRVVDVLLDRKWDLVRDLVDEDVHFDEIDFDALTIEDEEVKERLEELKEVEKHIINIKFGSVVYDW